MEELTLLLVAMLICFFIIQPEVTIVVGIITVIVGLLIYVFVPIMSLILLIYFFRQRKQEKREEDKKDYEIRMPDVDEFDKEMLLGFEKEVLGVYITGHPLEEYEEKWKKHITAKTTDFLFDDETGTAKVYDNQKATVGGMLVQRTIKYTKNNKTMAFLTLEDLVEEIFGEIEDEHDMKSYVARKVSDDEYLISGRMEIDTLNEKFNLELPESDDYVTIAGYILHFYQKFPKLNESIVIDKYTFKIIKVTATKIELVRMKVGN